MAYVYRHIRLDKNEPFYIGIGQKRDRNFRSVEAEFERAYSKAGRNVYWKRIIKNGFEVEILLDNITLEQAKEKEKEFIALYGRKDIKTGMLCNKTDGGENISNELLSKVSKKVINIDNNNIYNSVTEVAKKENFNFSAAMLRNKLNGKFINDTPYRYLDYNEIEYNKGQLLLNKKGDWCKVKLIDKVNNIVFESVTEASKYYNIQVSNLCSMLKGNRKNKTNLSYINI